MVAPTISIDRLPAPRDLKMVQKRRAFALLFYIYLEPSTRPLARPTRPWISEGMMIFVA